MFSYIIPVDAAGVILLWSHELAANMQTDEVVLFITCLTEFGFGFASFFPMWLLKIGLGHSFQLSPACPGAQTFLLASFNGIWSVKCNFSSCWSNWEVCRFVTRIEFISLKLLLHAVACRWKSVVGFFLVSFIHIHLFNYLLSFLYFSFPVWHRILYQWTRTSLRPACYTFICKGDFRKNGNWFC